MTIHTLVLPRFKRRMGEPRKYIKNNKKRKFKRHIIKEQKELNPKWINYNRYYKVFNQYPKAKSTFVKDLIDTKEQYKLKKHKTVFGIRIHKGNY